MRYTITFPDGFQLHQLVERSGRCLVFFSREDVPGEVIKRYEQAEEMRGTLLVDDERER